MSKFNGKELFENLFVLELANNHWGSLKRGLQIIKHHSSIVKYNNVKAAIKLQFRDVDEFVHPDFRGNRDLRYVSKTEATKLSRSDFAILVKVRSNVIKCCAGSTLCIHAHRKPKSV